MADFHLAQMNIANSRDSMESEMMQGFVNRLDEINALAEQSPGFVWRLQTEEGNATTIQAFEDPMLLVNLSVWEDIASLKRFVYQSGHVELIRERAAWFKKMVNVYQVLWWIPAGHTPSLAEGKRKLELLETQGPGEDAFTFARPFPVPET